MKILRTFGVMTFAFLAPAMLPAQTSRPAASPAGGESAAMQALVAEVRELRLSLERYSLLSMRFQAALQANQLHADRVKELSQQLNSVTTELSKTAKARLEMSESVKRLEQNLNSSDDARRNEAERFLGQFKIEMESLISTESELR